MAGLHSVILSSSPSIETSLVLEFLTQHKLQPAHSTIVTSSGGVAKQALQSASFDVAFSHSAVAGFHSAGILGNIAAWLRPGSTLLIQEPAGAGVLDRLQKELLLSGFVGSEAAQNVGNGDYVTVKASTPTWQAGAKAAISLKKPQTKPAAVQPSKAAFVLSDDFGDDELIDEEELLTEEDRARPAVPGADDVCNTGKKACANCTCGRAEAEAPPVRLTQDMLDNPTSGCGSCALGDAFRCAGCPYKGLPRFEMGKKIELPAGFLTADA